MATKKFKSAPFGTQTGRFDVSGIHPKSKAPGTYTEISYDKKSMSTLNRRLGPGVYDTEQNRGFSKSADHAKAPPGGWARQHEVERLARMPHLLHKEQWEHKQNLKRRLGPGTYEVTDFLEKSDQKPRSSRGICQTLGQRFNEKYKETPGPGIYGEGGIPHAAVERKQQQSTSTVGMLDAGSSQNRNLPSVGSHLGPGTYGYNSFTDNMSKKVTSVRGPYDLFSGDRNKPITTGHHAAPNQANLGPGQYDLKSFVDNTMKKAKHGKFSKVQKFENKPGQRVFCNTLSQCPRDESAPGPGNYDMKQLSKPEAKNPPGFRSSSQRNDRISQKFFSQNFNPVGPGRYDIQKYNKCQHENGNTSVFKSKTGKPNQTMEKFLKERVRAKDVRLEERVFIVKPDGAGFNRPMTVA